MATLKLSNLRSNRSLQLSDIVSDSRTLLKSRNGVSLYTTTNRTYIVKHKDSEYKYRSSTHAENKFNRILYLKNGDD